MKNGIDTDSSCVSTGRYETLLLSRCKDEVAQGLIASTKGEEEEGEAE